MTEQGGVAVSLHPSEDGYSQATIGFYTEGLANQLTGTEPNYDGVALDLYAETPKEGVGIENPLAYVSVWGALTQNGQDPVGTTHIPNTASSTMSTLEAIEFCRTVTGSEDSLEVFMRGNITNDDVRQQRTAMLQANFTLPASIKGEQVFCATKAGEPQVPAIEYRLK